MSDGLNLEYTLTSTSVAHALMLPFPERSSVFDVDLQTYLSAKAHIRGLRVNRYHTESVLKQENIAAHVGFMVGAAFLIYKTPSVDLLRAIAFHDHAEQVTGDAPAPAKIKFPEIKATLGKAESLFHEEYGIRECEESLSTEDLRRLKVLDRISGIAYSAHELELGNKSVTHVFVNFMNYLGKMSPTLDEMRFVGSVLFDITVSSDWVPSLNTGAVKIHQSVVQPIDTFVKDTFWAMWVEALGRDMLESKSE